MKFSSPLCITLAAMIGLAQGQPAISSDDDDSFAHVTFFSDANCEEVSRVAAMRPNQCSEGSEEFGSMMVDAAPKSGTIAVFGDEACGSQDSIMTLGQGARPMVEGKCVKIAQSGSSTTATSTAGAGVVSHVASVLGGVASHVASSATGTNQAGAPTLAATGKNDQQVSRRKTNGKPSSGKKATLQSSGKSSKGKSVKFTP